MNNIYNIISNKEITLLKNLDHKIDIDKKGKFKYYYINNMDIREIHIFVSRLHDEAIYSIIPFISISALDDDPHIILSKSILLTNYSSTKLVHDYLIEKLEQANLDFGLTNLEGQRFKLIFKYKRIEIDLTKIPK